MINPEVTKTLRDIMQSHDGLLKPRDVVAEARKSSSILHEYFEWNDNEAAEQYRLWQAKILINSQVEYIEGRDKPMQVFVSLTSDRINDEGGGYRELIAVLKNSDKTQQLLEDAKRDMETFIEKYNTITELGKVIVVMRKVKKKLE